MSANITYIVYCTFQTFQDHQLIFVIAYHYNRHHLSISHIMLHTYDHATAVSRNCFCKTNKHFIKSSCIPLLSHFQPFQDHFFAIWGPHFCKLFAAECHISVYLTTIVSCIPVYVIIVSLSPQFALLHMLVTSGYHLSSAINSFHI